MVVLTEKQQQIFEWLNSKLRLPVYAEAYKGAVCLLKKKSPGYVTFVSHAGRELMNSLPRTVAGIRSSYVQYAQHVDKLKNKWQNEWRGQGLTLSQHPREGHVIPYSVCEMIANLIEEHREGGRRDQEKDDSFFNTFLGYSDQDKIPSLKKWRDTKVFFQKRNHFREEGFSLEDQSRVVENFKILEDFLHIAATSEYSRIRSLDAILEEANK